MVSQNGATTHIKQNTLNALAPIWNLLPDVTLPIEKPKTLTAKADSEKIDVEQF